MALFNGYQEGHEAGYQAGLKGESADPVQSHGLLKMMGQALKLQSFTDTFLEGWREGYRKGAEARKRG